MVEITFKNDCAFYKFVLKYNHSNKEVKYGC